MSRKTLKINPKIKATQYQYYFGVSYSTAKRLLSSDKKEHRKPLFTFLDFYMLYDAFPDPKFNANWLTVE